MLALIRHCSSPSLPIKQCTCRTRRPARRSWHTRLMWRATIVAFMSRSTTALSMLHRRRLYSSLLLFILFYFNVGIVLFFFYEKKNEIDINCMWIWMDQRFALTNRLQENSKHTLLNTRNLFVFFNFIIIIYKFFKKKTVIKRLNAIAMLLTVLV